jgi:hypothetical protein
MTVTRFVDAPESDVAEALERFERQFTYPLGPGRWFRISHGQDYPRFYRAMGDAACFVAMRGGQVLGVVGAAIRRLLLPDGQEQQIVHLGDLKIDPAARGGWTLVSLGREVRTWIGADARTAFGVVMDGTPVTPERYTGRFGIPPFVELGKIAALRLPTLPPRSYADEEWQASETHGLDCYIELSRGRYASHGGYPAERSEMTPEWLVSLDRSACGRLEDTRRAKRLFADDGSEMSSAHLSCFAYRDERAGVELLRAALSRAGSLGYPALFVAIAAPTAAALVAELGDVQHVTASATVYGSGLKPGPLWNINTAEI